MNYYKVQNHAFIPNDVFYDNCELFIYNNFLFIKTESQFIGEDILHITKKEFFKTKKVVTIQ